MIIFKKYVFYAYFIFYFILSDNFFEVYINLFCYKNVISLIVIYAKLKSKESIFNLICLLILLWYF